MSKQLYKYCCAGNLNEVKKLIDLNIIFCAHNNFALRTASAHGHLNIVQYLVSLGADFRDNNNSAVRVASANGHLHIVQYLIDLGADFCADNNNAVNWACMFGHLDVVQYLLLKGAYHPNILVSFELIDNLYYLGHFSLIHKLIHNNKHNVHDDKREQFDLITKSVNKIIDARKWNRMMFIRLNFTDVVIK